MSRMDPECFPYPGDDRAVCAACFDDPDLRRWIRGQDGPNGCDFCGRSDTPTTTLGEVAVHIRSRMGEFYGAAVDQLPYESAEGGYQGWHVETADLLFDTIGLELPRDSGGELADALISEIGDDTWCEHDWLSLGYDHELKSDWEWFCRVLTQERRYFFGALEPDDDTRRTLMGFLHDLASLIDELGMITDWPAGTPVYRARPRRPGQRFTTAAELGPPPRQASTQANRMNPPGIPMMYAADRRKLTCAEARSPLVSVGKFVLERPVRVLNLADMPAIPGFFSNASRRARLGLTFLRDFGREVSMAVPRDDRVHIEYVPTQAFVEFMRFFEFSGGRIDGVRYRSATSVPGANIVLFATQADVVTETLIISTTDEGNRWIRLESVRHLDVAAAEARISAPAVFVQSKST